MLTGIDHVIVASADPDLAVAEVERVLGLRATGGGRHEAHGTFNRLIWLGDGYLELMGVFDSGRAAESWWGRHVSGLLDASAAAYAGLALASNDLEADVALLRAQGAPIGEPDSGERRRPDGDVVRWSIARPPDVDVEVGLTFLIQHDQTAAEWRPADREARAEEVHPLGGPVRLARVELPVTDMRRSTMRVHRDLGVAFRPSLAGGGARDGTVGGQTLRLVRAAAGRLPTVVMRGGPQTREADLAGCRFTIEAVRG
jgi:catechol 2,3-dioxygenase-like lactoylglutathione lyase family enzyme